MGEEKNSAVWTTNATTLLLKLYESNLGLLETPKKKRRIWAAISEDLKNYNISMSPDQVRWKINALTKKYKNCIEMECHNKFKYFREMDNIYSKYNVDSDAYFISEFLDEIKLKRGFKRLNHFRKNKSLFESKHTIEMRKMRLAYRIESDRSQHKLNLERQWLEYLQRQEAIRLEKAKMIEHSLNIKEQELELRKKEMAIYQSIELKKIQMKERDLNNIIILEKEKCSLLEELFLK